MKKRILFVAPFPPPIHGAALRNQSVAVSKIINEMFNMRTFHANQASDVHDIGRFSWRKIMRTFTDLFKLIFALITFRPHLVYFNISLFGFALYRDAIYTSLFKLFRHKILYHLRTQGVREQIEKSRFKKSLFSYLFHNVDVICLSQALFQDIAPIYKGTPYIINNGIAIEKVNFKTSTANSIPQILFLSNFSIKKGINELFLALQQLKNKKLGFQAIIVGKPFDYTEKDLKSKAKELEIEDILEIKGPLYGEQKLKVFSSSDIFVLPTYFEAFPGVILEAMQFGLPVVSTREGAIPEIVDDKVTGILTEKQNVKDLTESLAILIVDDKLRRNMGSKGKEKFFERYTLEAFENNMVQVFSKVLDDE